MKWYRMGILCVTLSVLVTACHAAPERKVAGIRIGMRIKEVIELLGEPDAYLIAQPPIANMMPTLGVPGMPEMPGTPGAPGMPGSPQNPAVAVTDNTLIFLYKGQETEIDPTGSPDAGIGQLPLWAYTVRVSRLAIDQQELLYQINDTYSIGVTITGQEAEGRVTDIIACSFEPLKRWPDKPERTLERKKINFTRTSTKKVYYAGTSKGVRIGSKFSEVLTAHKWPPVFIPFATSPVQTVVVERDGPKVVPNKAPTMVPPSVGLTQIGVSLTQADNLSLPVNFADNFIMMYPDDSLALTIINMTVVRIQIGEGVVKPAIPEPPALPEGVGGAGAPPSGMIMR